MRRITLSVLLILGIMRSLKETGEVPEWTIGAVSKTVVASCATVGSNPTLSANYFFPLPQPIVSP